MHIEKNMCDSLLGNLLNIAGKTKDEVRTRLDLIQMGIQKKLAPKVCEKRTYLPPASFMLTKEEKHVMHQCLFDVKVPNGYSYNIRALVDMKGLKSIGLKSHDCHKLIKYLLPIASVQSC